MNKLKYFEILKLNKELEDNKRKTYNISLLSNVIVHQAKDIIEYLLRDNGINANIVLGDYDNIVQDSQIHKQTNSVIIFWELINLVDGLQYKIDILKNNSIKEIEKKIKKEVEFVVINLQHCPLLIINKFTPILFSRSSII